MQRFCLAAVGIAMLVSIGLAQTPSAGPTRCSRRSRSAVTEGSTTCMRTSLGRRVYIPRGSMPPHMTVFDLDTLAPVRRHPEPPARGAAVDPKSGHGFASSKPVVMWDTKTMKAIKTIDVQGNPDGIMFDPFNDRVWVFSHAEPHATIINAADGSVVGTLNLGGQPEQAVTDSKGHIYVDLEDTNQIAVVDAKAMKVTAHYGLGGKGGAPAGLAFDVKNHILFAAGSEPPTMVILNADDGKVITSLPIGAGVDGAVFNPGDDGSLQFATRRHADGRQGEQPDQFRRRANGEDDAEREDADARQQDESDPADRRRVRPSASAAARGRTRARSRANRCRGRFRFSSSGNR